MARYYGLNEGENQQEVYGKFHVTFWTKRCGFMGFLRRSNTSAKTESIGYLRGPEARFYSLPEDSSEGPVEGQMKKLQDDGCLTRWELSSCPSGHMARFMGSSKMLQSSMSH